MFYNVVLSDLLVICWVFLRLGEDTWLLVRGVGLN